MHIFKENELGNDSKCKSKTGFVKLILPLGCGHLKSRKSAVPSRQPLCRQEDGTREGDDLAVVTSHLGARDLSGAHYQGSALARTRCSAGVLRRDQGVEETLPRPGAGTIPSLLMAGHEDVSPDRTLEGRRPDVPLQPNPRDLSFQSSVLPQTQ